MINAIKLVIVGDKNVGKTTISSLLCSHFQILEGKENYREANIALIIISEKRSSHKNINYWLTCIRKIIDIPILIVRNKCDINSNKYTLYKIDHYISVFDDNLFYLIKDIKKKAVFREYSL